MQLPSIICATLSSLSARASLSKCGARLEAFLRGPI